jgi:hypothetical protein
VGKQPAIRRSAGAEDEQDQGEQSESDLDVIAVDLGCKGEDLVFHWTPLSIDWNIFQCYTGAGFKGGFKKNNDY